MRHDIPEFTHREQGIHGIHCGSMDIGTLHQQDCRLSVREQYQCGATEG